MALVSDELTIASGKHVKGVFTDERDTALACRFYYYSRLMEKRYDVCLKNLSREFYISETVCTQLLTARQEYLKELRMKNTTRYHLRKLYPHLNWN